MTADRHKQNSNDILTVIQCGLSVPDTRGEVEDGEGPGGERAGDAGRADGNEVMLVAGPGTWQMVKGQLGMVQMAVVEIGAWQWS